MQSTSERRYHVIWRADPPDAAQLTAWRQLWARLLEHVKSGLETPQPQDHVEPRAATLATAANGHNFLSELNDDTRCTSHSK